MKSTSVGAHFFSARQTVFGLIIEILRALAEAFALRRSNN
ncbi:hypothetical protein HMPREF3226_01378 [Prevotella corporis]|uniref:Uncharacterized protein n=1 Tax=Prevotella corporis TaxID=28128 RepID=A0A133Q9J6_9BACT|nr:hypothetical protein HMPREF3226_01378 [Prevotella corporis]